MDLLGDGFRHDSPATCFDSGYSSYVSRWSFFFVGSSHSACLCVGGLQILRWTPVVLMMCESPGLFLGTLHTGAGLWGSCPQGHDPRIR